MKAIIRVNKIEEEEMRVKNTLMKLDWYKEKDYFFVLPKSSVREEYDTTNYRLDKITVEWRKVEKAISKKLSKVLRNKLQKEYIVCLTRYGVGGSYYLPNMIILNVSDEYLGRRDPVETIEHEIIHLSIEPLIQKYKVGHWQKERIVDLIASKIISGYRAQKIPVETKAIDESFNKLFPDIEKIIKSI